MAQSQHAPVRPRKRRFWFDPRFAVGLALVVVSVLGVTLLVTTADRTDAVYAASSALSVGDRVRAADLAITRVRLGGTGGAYLEQGALPDGGVIVTRTIAAGELIPAAAVGDPAGVDVSSVVVVTQGRLARVIDSGQVVDVWAAREGEGGIFGPPGVLVPSASVVRVLEADGLIANEAAASVEILVPKDRIAHVLEALANADSISLVPVHRPMGG